MLEEANGRAVSAAPGIMARFRHLQGKKTRIAALKGQITADLEEAKRFEQHGMEWGAQQHRLNVARSVEALMDEGAL